MDKHRDSAMEIISKKEAVKDGLKYYFTGRPCKRGHLSKRYLGGQCQECVTTQRNAWYRSNRDLCLRRASIWASENRDRTVEYKRLWRTKNPEKQRASETSWRSNNSAYEAARCAMRSAAKIRRTPPWLTKEHRAQIAWYYRMAKHITEQTGVQYSVDHIVPLRADNASGLHVPWNLQVITLSANCSKGNRFIGTDVAEVTAESL